MGVTVTYVGSERAIQHKPCSVDCDPIQFYRDTPVDLAQHFAHTFMEAVPKYAETVTGTDEDGQPVTARKRVGTESAPLTVDGAAKLDTLVKSLAAWYEREVQIAKKAGGLSSWEVRRPFGPLTKVVRTEAAERHGAIKIVLKGSLGSVVKWLEGQKVDNGLLDLLETAEKEGQGRKTVLSHIVELRQKLRRGESANPTPADVDGALEELLEDQEE